MKKTKKLILTLATCLIVSIMLVSGCAQPLITAPTNTSNLEVVGDVLVYDDYIYFANAFKSYSSLKANDNDTGRVKNEALYRVKLNNKAIEYDEKTNMPKNVESVISKVAGSEHSFLYSIGKYIFFASPNTHKDKSSADKFELTSYHRINTDGTGLKEFYITQKEVSQQGILKIENKYYLIFVEGTSLVKIEIGETIGKPVILASEITKVVFAEKYTTFTDRYAYYTTAIEDSLLKQGIKGTYLNKVDMVSGESTIQNKDSYLNKEITPICVTFGNFYFTMNEDDSKTYYYSYTSGNLSTKKQITLPIDNVTISHFSVIKSQNNDIYHIFKTDNDKKTYCLKEDEDKYFNAQNLLVENDAIFLFISGDFLYYAIEKQGIYRVSVLDKEIQTVILCEDFKTSNIGFDGKYVYFYAVSENNVTGTYYLHRTDIRSAEVGTEASIELIGFLDKQDMPNEDDDE